MCLDARLDLPLTIDENEGIIEPDPTYIHHQQHNEMLNLGRNLWAEIIQQYYTN